jgi:hypothetical protein
MAVIHILSPRGTSARRRKNALVARMYRDYQRGLSMEEVGRKHGGRTLHAVYALFKRRALPARKKMLAHVWQKVAATRRSKLDPLVHQMHADYMLPMSLSAVGRKYGRSRKDLRGLFVARGLTVRVVQKPPRKLANGQIAAYVPFTPPQIEQLIRSATKFCVPTELKFEWRQWSLERRREFIARLRAHLKRPDEMPLTPLSANVEAFEYGSPRAHAIAKQMNAGRDSRTKAVHLHICSQGVIWREQLWFWSSKTGYERGPWTKKYGRPLLHHVIYKEAHGPIPAGHVLRFVDGNQNNLVPENLALETRNDVCRQNHGAALVRKSRALTALLLKRHQGSKQNHDTQTLVTLSRGNL